MSSAFGLILDILMLVFLAVTIFYGARLSFYLRNFRDSRPQFERLFLQLGKDIERAENVIAGMKRAADDSGKKLQERLNEARFLSDELRFMNEAGHNLADRLEGLAERSGEIREVPPKFPAPRAAPERPAPKREASFSIRDKELETASGMNAQGLLPEEEEEEGEGKAPSLPSVAERELYEALRRRKKTAGNYS